MNRPLGLLLMASAGASLSFGAVDGVVINQSTGKPAANSIISLVQPSQTGMQTIASKKTDAAGKFAFTQDLQGPQMLQAFFDGVIYTKVVFPGAPAAGITVDVYNSTNKAAVAKLTQHFIVLQPTTTALNVSESFSYEGDPKLTYNDPSNGTLRFYLPPAADKAHITIQTPGGMPIERQPDKSKEPNIYKSDYAIKPGQTRFDIVYSLPVASPLVFSSKVLQASTPTELVTPNGVTLKSDDIETLGQEPKTQANIYRAKNASFTVEVNGTGSLGGDAGGTEEDSGQPSLQQVNPRIYGRMPWILGLSFTILALGFTLLYRHRLAR
jgi:hypothetical protein